MSERNYYVVCDDHCLFPAMTKEETLTAIQQAVEHGEIHNVDTGFVTTLKEQNANAALKMWVGTQAQYNAIANPDNNTLYIITDEDGMLAQNISNEISLEKHSSTEADMTITNKYFLYNAAAKTVHYYFDVQFTDIEDVNKLYIKYGGGYAPTAKMYPITPNNDGWKCVLVPSGLIQGNTNPLFSFQAPVGTTSANVHIDGWFFCLGQ